MDKPFCCYIDDAGKECGADAEFVITEGCSPDDQTECCRNHITEMLSDKFFANPKAASVRPLEAS